MRARRRDAPRSLRQLRSALRRRGVSQDAIERATDDDTLPLLAVERLAMPERPTLDAADLAVRSDLDEEQLVRFWRALGFPDPVPDDRIYTEADLQMALAVGHLLRSGLIEPDLSLQMTRVIGSTMARLASAQVDAIEASMADRGHDDRAGEDDPVTPAATAGLALQLMPAVMTYAWRRHLQDAARRRLVRVAGDEDERRAVVGFADLVGFTALSQQVSDHELAAVLERFEALAYDLVAEGGGRVVKMIGDEVMFTTDDVDAGLEIALRLAERLREADDIPDVRVGLAEGELLTREGDLYGAVVNLAHRIVAIAYPGAVVVSDDVRRAAGDDEEHRWQPLRTHVLKDIGRVKLWMVQREGDPDAGGLLERTRGHRLAVWQRVADLFAGEGAAAGDPTGPDPPPEGER